MKRTEPLCEDIAFKLPMSGCTFGFFFFLLNEATDF